MTLSNHETAIGDDRDEPVRLDKWLWAARFFKTRSLAVAAINGGKVFVNTQRTKPARAIGIGDVLRVRRGEDEYTVRVIRLSTRRGPAQAARLLYEETPESMTQRAVAAEQRRLQPYRGPAPHRRPTKRERRELLEMRRRPAE